MAAQAFDWVPVGINLEVPSAARIYDYLLGGGHNFAADRAVSEKVLRVLPNGREVARSNRAFLARAVRYMIDEGIRQFLDLGSGIPTAGNVHEVVQHMDPNSRVVYVDDEPVVVAHSELILRDDDRTAVVQADLCHPEEVLAAPEVQRLIDFSQPVGLLTVAVFHFVPDQRNPAEILARYRAALPSGSLVALSHLTADQFPGEMAAVVEAMRNSRDPMYFRTYDDVVALFDGLDLAPPGVVSAPNWRAEPGADTGQEGVYAGVGRKL